MTRALATAVRTLAVVAALGAATARGAERGPPVEDDPARAFAAARARGALVLVDVWAPW